MSIDRRLELQENLFAVRERRSFQDRARADRIVGLWGAAYFGLKGTEAEAYAGSIVGAGVARAGGRGGFDKLTEDLQPLGVEINLIRAQYAIAMATEDSSTTAAPAYA